MASSDGEPRVQQLLDRAKSLLVPGESIEAWAIVRRLFALTRRRTVVLATTGRLLGLRRKLIAGFELIDLRWQDLKEARIRVGIFGADLDLLAYASSDLTMASDGGRRITFEGLRKEQAQEVYRICQSHEQAWREKRRVREIEELRAKSGGVHVGTGGVAAAADAGQGAGAAIERLRQLKTMQDEGLITDAEFQSLKAKVVNGL